jgi:hypothetical protein
MWLLVINWTTPEAILMRKGQILVEVEPTLGECIQSAMVKRQWTFAPLARRSLERVGQTFIRIPTLTHFNNHILHCTTITYGSQPWTMLRYGQPSKLRPIGHFAKLCLCVDYHVAPANRFSLPRSRKPVNAISHSVTKLKQLGFIAKN